MKLPLQVSFHGIDRSEALENLIAKEVEGLHKFDADLISCRVAVESEGRHQNQGRECSVRVSLNALRETRTLHSLPWFWWRPSLSTATRQLIRSASNLWSPSTSFAIKFSRASERSIPWKLTCSGSFI